ncbi:hypothetical protein CLV58_10896 [Spirosoma oryzae]|uniref:Uncharacterized protein n=1 Tax=Spirosoma oryzae TaxID=1469603 RepID=A0A2T0T0L9_9BACT|nr:hypothetical protein [Spirosoma oryzae]PRY39206.1 hypothetical protein CLV58_10896 [Spirosoma oryzae]
MSKQLPTQYARLLAGLLLALPLAGFVLLWQRYAVNVPKWDDHALRHFLLLADQAPTLSNKLYQFVKQHNEHRIAYDRIIAWLDYQLTGKLNFRHLMVVGNLSLLGLLLVFVSVLRRAGRPLLYAVPVACLLFNLSQWENMYWGMAALQNFSIMLWVVGAVYYLSYTNRLTTAIGLAVLATLTSGNGLLVWPIGALILFLRLAQPHSTRRPLVTWLLISGGAIGLYFIGFTKPGDIAYVQASIGTLLGGWFAFMGATAQIVPVTSSLRLCTLLGGLMVLGALVVIGWSGLTHRQAIGRSFQWLVVHPKKRAIASGAVLPPATLFFWGTALFLLITGLVVARARVGFGADLLITSRYKPYSLTLLALLYTYAVVWLGGQLGQWTMRLGILAGLLVGGLSYLSFLDETIWWRHWLLTNQFNWRYSTNRPVEQVDSVTRQYLEPAPAFYTDALSVLFGPVQGSVVPVQVDSSAAGYRITNESLLADPTRSPDAGAYVVARSAKRTYLFPVWQTVVSPVSARFMPGRLFKPGFHADFTRYELAKDTYALHVLIVDPGQPYRLYPTNKTLTSAGPPPDTTSKNW